MKKQNQTNWCQVACIKSQRIPVFRKIRTQKYINSYNDKERTENKKKQQLQATDLFLLSVLRHGSAFPEISPLPPKKSLLFLSLPLRCFSKVRHLNPVMMAHQVLVLFTCACLYGAWYKACPLTKPCNLETLDAPFSKFMFAETSKITGNVPIFINGLPCSIFV